MTALVVLAAALASTALGVGLLAWQARLAFALWLEAQRQAKAPAVAAPAPDVAALTARIDALELKVAQHDVARLAGRR